MKLRLFNQDDANYFYRWYHDPRLSHFYREFVTGVSVAECGRAPEIMRGHVLTCVDGEQRLGCASLVDRSRVLRNFEFGFFVDPDIQHQGIGKFILDEAMKWAFHTMNAHRLIFKILATDTRIIRGAERAGFVLEGTMRQSCYVDGVTHDEVLFSLLKSEYEAIYGRR